MNIELTILEIENFKKQKQKQKLSPYQEIQKTMGPFCFFFGK